MKKSIIVVASIILLASCNQNQKPYKVGYVNLMEVYNLPTFKDIDSIYQSKKTGIKNYALIADKKVRALKVSNNELKLTVKAYQDTIQAYEQQAEKEFLTKLNVEKSKVQKLIDSFAKKEAFNYVLSTTNSNILFVKDTTNNLTEKVIKAYK